MNMLTRHAEQLIMPTVHFDTKIVHDPEQRRKKRDIPASLQPGNPNSAWLPKKGKTIKGPGAALDVAPQPFDLTTCNTQITPDCLRALYSFPNGTLAMSSYGVVEYTPQAYLQADLNLFYSNLAREIPSGTAPTFDSIDGGVDQTTTQSFDDNGESDLDLEYAIALGVSYSPSFLAFLLDLADAFHSLPPEGDFIPDGRSRRGCFVQQLPRCFRFFLLYLWRWR